MPRLARLRLLRPKRDRRGRRGLGTELERQRLGRRPVESSCAPREFPWHRAQYRPLIRRVQVPDQLPPETCRDQCRTQPRRRTCRRRADPDPDGERGGDRLSRGSVPAGGVRLSLPGGLRHVRRGVQRRGNQPPPWCSSRAARRRIRRVVAVGHRRHLPEAGGPCGQLSGGGAVEQHRVGLRQLGRHPHTAPVRHRT